MELSTLIAQWSGKLPPVSCRRPACATSPVRNSAAGGTALARPTEARMPRASRASTAGTPVAEGDARRSSRKAAAGAGTRCAPEPELRLHPQRHDDVFVLDVRQLVRVEHDALVLVGHVLAVGDAERAVRGHHARPADPLCLTGVYSGLNEPSVGADIQKTCEFGSWKVWRVISLGEAPQLRSVRVAELASPVCGGHDVVRHLSDGP